MKVSWKVSWPKEFLSKLENHRIAVYGLGTNAKAAIDALAGLNVVGLMDRDPANVGRTVYGYHVLSTEEAVAQAEIILIASDPANWRTIFRRIAFLKTKYGKRIFFLNGEEPLLETENFWKCDPYWASCKEELTSLLTKYTVVSFDIFDTLLGRKVFQPADIFMLTEKRLQAEGLPVRFVYHRVQAEREAARLHGGVCTWAQIYEEFRERTGLSEMDAERCRCTEEAAELTCIVPRPTMVELLNRCRQEGKTILLVSDMYLPSDFLGRQLQKYGVAGWDALFVSGEAGKSKRDGGLWENVRRFCGGRPCLHIGDDALGDGANARAHGFDTFEIRSAGRMLAASSAGSAADPHGDGDSAALGLIASRLLNNPFALHETGGKLCCRSPEDLGYACFGPLILCYFGWLFRQLREDGADVLLFFARDGYFLEKIYRHIVERTCRAAPPGIYFKTSRRMACVAALRTEEDLFAALEDSFSGTLRSLLRDRFGVETNLPEDGEILTQQDPKAKEAVRQYKNVILQNAAREREAYLSYIRTLRLGRFNRIAVSDQGFKGTIQFWLSRLLGRPLVGYYFIAFTGEENPWHLGRQVHALFDVRRGETPLGSQSCLYQFQLFFESVFTAPTGTYLYARSDGSFAHAAVHLDKKRFGVLTRIYDGIVQFADDYTALFPGTMEYPPSKQLADTLFGLAANGNIGLSEEIRSSCCGDNAFGGSPEKRNVFA